MPDTDKARTWQRITQGVMLNKNTFIKADDVYEVMVPRKEYYATVDRPMLILTNATELTLDGKGEIIADEHHAKFGLWKELVKCET